MVGILGGLRFRVSDNRVLTFQNFKMEVSASWNTVERIGMKPLTEYGGPNLRAASFDVVLDASLGVKPKKLLTTIERMVESGEVNDLIVGKKRIGKNKWAVTKCSESWDVILRGGELYRAKVSLSLQEYV